MAGIIPGTNTPSSIVGAGTIKRDSGVLAGHIFNVGLEIPQILETLIIKYPQYYLLDLTEKIAGASKDLYNNTLTWNVMGRTRKSATASSVANGTTATATITTDIAFSSAQDNAGYFLVGDTLYIPNSGARARVTAVGNSGAFQTIDVVRPEGGNWSTALLTTNFKLGHVGTSFGEGSTGSGGFRSYFPDSDYNVTTILRRGFKVTRNMMKDKTWIDKETWYYKQEDFEHKEFMRDIEASTVFGTRFKSTSLGGANQSRGLLEYAEGSGKIVTYSSAVGCQEADLVYLIQQLLPENGSNDLIMLCGETLLIQIQQALGNNYRNIGQSEKPRELAGMAFQSYEIAGKRIHFAYYELFSDDAIVPQVTASSTAKDFRNFGLVLDFGTVAGQGVNIEMHYLQRLIQKMIPGMASPGMEIANAFDGVQGELLAEFLPAVYLPNRLGLIYSNS